MSLPHRCTTLRCMADTADEHGRRACTGVEHQPAASPLMTKAARSAGRIDLTASWIGPWVSRDQGINAERPRLLLLCDYRPREAATVLDHINAIRLKSRTAVYVLPMYGDIPDDLDLEAFDGLIIHYNLQMRNDKYLSRLARWRISRYTGVKAAFIQDEYRFVDETVSVMRTLGIEILFSCVPPGEVTKVYPPEVLPKLRRVVNVLTGYVPEHLLTIPVRSYEDRTIEVGYRGRRLPAWLGELAQEKVGIAERFSADATSRGLVVDISVDEHDRLYGAPWVEFIRSCRAMLGTESGASVFDFDGSIEAAVGRHLAAHPGTSFAELQRLYFADREGRIRLNQISPRSFEAAALGTLMVMYPGEYSGILEPWRHYVPLAKDHSNMQQVVDAIRDRALWQDITDRARTEVALNPAHSYQAMVDSIDDAMDLHPSARATVVAGEFLRLARRSFAAMPYTKLYAFGLPPRVNRVRLRVVRVAGLLKPNATSIAPYAVQTVEGMHRLRHWIRHVRAFAYWAARPSVLPAKELVLGRRRLLEDLGELRQLQVAGRRALTTTGLSPYILTLDPEEGELRLGTAPATASPGYAIAGLPDDLSVRSIRLDIDDRWFVSSDAPARLHGPLEALSALARNRPAVVRRLLTHWGPWCTILLKQPGA